jgi:MFS family permease
LLVPLSDGRFTVFVVLTGLLWMIFHQCFVTLPIDLRSHGLSPSTYGVLIAENGLLIVLLQPAVSRALSRYPRQRVLALAALLTGAGFGITGLVRGIAGYAGAIAVWTMGEISMAGLGPTVAADASPPQYRGAYQGLFQAGIGAATLLAPAFGSFLLERFGSVALWSSCGVLGLLVAAGHLLLGPLRRPSLATAAAVPSAATAGATPTTRSP